LEGVFSSGHHLQSE
jgi:hypothetical protein